VFLDANGGTVFLDEIAELPLPLQPKLLRALQEKSFERLGGTKTIPIDVRLVAATNRNLAQMMGDKLFRSDLYYRLKVFPILTPPLRDRPEDIPLLARHFLHQHAQRYRKQLSGFDPGAMQQLLDHRWPGNVRELDHAIERAVLMSGGHAVRSQDLGLRVDGGGAARLEDMSHEEVEAFVKAVRLPAGRFGDAEDLGALVAMFCADQASYVTGQSLVVDGGITVGPRHAWDPAAPSPMASIFGDALPTPQG
jgi:transcriptional regulator with PAS, ATPase and Fis domain